MNLRIRDILSLDRTLFLVTAHSKKKIFEMVSEVIAASIPSLQPHDIFDGFIARERLGSTAIGHGVAIPHTRIDGLNKAIGSFILLKDGIDFDAEDHLEIDLLFPLIIPVQVNKEHLALLASIAQLFAQEKVRQDIRHAPTKQALYEKLISV